MIQQTNADALLGPDGQLAAIRWDAAPLGWRHEVRYRYGAASGRLERTTEPAAGVAWHYGYDGRGQVTSGEKHRFGAALDGHRFGYGFDAGGNRLAATREGRTSTYTPDPDTPDQYASRTVPGALDIVGAADAAATVTVNG